MINYSDQRENECKPNSIIKLKIGSEIYVFTKLKNFAQHKSNNNVLLLQVFFSTNFKEYLIDCKLNGFWFLCLIAYLPLRII